MVVIGKGPGYHRRPRNEDILQQAARKKVVTQDTQILGVILRYECFVLRGRFAANSPVIQSQQLRPLIPPSTQLGHHVRGHTTPTTVFTKPVT